MPHENVLTHTILSRHFACKGPEGGLLLKTEEWL